MESYKSVKLSDGTTMPTVGLGTWLSKDENVLKDLIIKAIELGYRHFDTAKFYFNEKLLGKAFKEAISSGKVKREELYITTKVFPLKEFNAISVLKQCLEDLQLDYVDLYLAHWPIGNPTADKEGTIQLSHKPVHRIWPEIEQCKEMGLTKSIGVSNYNVQSLFDLLSYCKIRPVVNQIELHPYLAQNGLVEACKRFKIQVVAYCPLARGGAAQTNIFGQKNDILNDAVFVKLAKKYNKTTAQIILNYIISRGIPVLPKTEKESRLGENLNCTDFCLTEDELKEVSKLDQNLRVVDTKTLKEWEFFDVFS